MADVNKLPVSVAGLGVELYAVKLTDLAAFARQKEEAITKHCEEAKAVHRGYFVFSDGEYEVFQPRNAASANAVSQP
jgi:hypothetical protein